MLVFVALVCADATVKCLRAMRKPHGAYCESQVRKESVSKALMSDYFRMFLSKTYSRHLLLHSYLMTSEMWVGFVHYYPLNNTFFMLIVVFRRKSLRLVYFGVIARWVRCLLPTISYSKSAISRKRILRSKDSKKSLSQFVVF